LVDLFVGHVAFEMRSLRIDFQDLRSPGVATEFVGTSISSGGDGQDAPPGLSTLLSENPSSEPHAVEEFEVPAHLRNKFLEVRQVVPVQLIGDVLQTRCNGVRRLSGLE
jgi:phosphodiesterase/alkaline phosphatase D-like protein